MTAEEYNEESRHESDEIQKALSDLADLKKTVNTTRLNRIHASVRLLETERFVQGLNIYYSCTAAIVSILSLIDSRGSFPLASTMMTVVLAISTVYLNAQKYERRAQQLQTNYLALYQLKFEVEEAERKKDVEQLRKLQAKYVKMLQTSENHITQDYRLTLWELEQKAKRKGDTKSMNQLLVIERIKLFGRSLFKYLIRIFLVSLPMLYFAWSAYMKANR